MAAGVSKFQVVGGTYEPADKFIDAQAFSIFIAPGASNNYQITNINAYGNTLGGINDQGTGINKIIKNNTGNDDAGFQTIASAASISLGTTDQSVYYISGGTPITTIQGAGGAGSHTDLYRRRGLGTGGNINRAQTAVQYQAIRLTFDGTGCLSTNRSINARGP